jgi:hypothetical protein
MFRRHFESRGELELQLDAARQLRSESRAGAVWMFSRLLGVVGAIRRVLLRISADPSRRA